VERAASKVEKLETRLVAKLVEMKADSSVVRKVVLTVLTKVVQREVMLVVSMAEMWAV
jgi:hypothetical protein